MSRSELSVSAEQNVLEKDLNVLRSFSHPTVSTTANDFTSDTFLSFFLSFHFFLFLFSFQIFTRSFCSDRDAAEGNE